MKISTIILIFYLFFITTSYSQNPAGMALSLDGAEDYMFVGIAPELQILGDVTVEAWIYADSYDFSFVEIVQQSGPSPDVEENNVLYTLSITSDSIAGCFHENGPRS